MRILVTGGAGYIGSHTCIELLKAGYEVIILDNLYNSKQACLDRVEALSGKAIPFVKGDIRDRALLERVFRAQTIDAVIHFAGLKAVAESVEKPLEYYDNNIGGTVTLLMAMRDAGCKNIVFSSSATVYGAQNPSPLKENMPDGVTTNPYGTTKLYIEHILKDLYTSDNAWGVSLLRYFNPIGAHESGQIGEDPMGIPKNIMPIITQVAVGKRPYVEVCGTDYDTHDGTGVRDYIHVVDLARGHVMALDKLLKGPGCNTYNLGTGIGYSVFDIIHAFEEASGVKIPYQLAPRRPGDVAVCYSDPSKAKQELGFETQYDLARMCADSWRWQSQNPKGFPD